MMDREFARRRIGHALGMGRGRFGHDLGPRGDAPNPRGFAFGLRTGGDPDRGLGHQQANRQTPLPGLDKLTHASRARSFRAAPLPVPPAAQGSRNPGASGVAILPPASGGGRPTISLPPSTPPGPAFQGGPVSIGHGLAIGRGRGR